MPYCTKCGKEVAEGSSFCQSCGEKLSAPQGSMRSASLSSVITDEDFATFIGKNAEKYLTKFTKFNADGVDSFEATWHWPAFFVPFFWMLYRKLYLWALLTFVLGIIPYFGFFAMIAFGLTGTYIYYKHAKKKLLELKGLHPSSDVQRAIEIACAGGVNNVAIVVAPLVLIAVVGILAAIAIPQYAAYRQKAFDARAKSDIQQACSEASSIFIETPETTITQPALEERGFKPSPDVQLVINDGTRPSFNMTASHDKGNMIYSADINCNISEKVKAR